MIQDSGLPNGIRYELRPCASLVLVDHTAAKCLHVPPTSETTRSCEAWLPTHELKGTSRTVAVIGLALRMRLDG